MVFSGRIEVTDRIGVVEGRGLIDRMYTNGRTVVTDVWL